MTAQYASGLTSVNTCKIVGVEKSNVKSLEMRFIGNGCCKSTELVRFDQLTIPRYCITSFICEVQIWVRLARSCGLAELNSSTLIIIH